MDLYELLGVGRAASLTEIRRAFRKRQRQLHPAVNPGDPIAAVHFEAVSKAFDVLSDPKRRADYDHTGELPKTPTAVPELGFEGFDFSVNVGSGAGFRELFESGAPAGSPTPGEDLEHQTRVTFTESLKGAKRRIHVMRQDRCAACQGAGEVSFAPVVCPTCNGAGRVRTARGHMVFMRRCPECGARGVLGRRPCPQCAGQGRLMHSEWIEVTVPAGVESGSQVRVPGFGNAGPFGGPPGDLVLTLEVEPHPFYRRNGEDLYCTLPVSFTEAALGAHVEVPAP